jgi:small-conductance mechanosensitive channel
MNGFFDNVRSILDRAGDHLPEVAMTLLIGILAIEVGLPLFSHVLRLFGVRRGIRKVLKSLLRAFLYVVIFIATLKALGLDSILVVLTGSSVILALFLSTGVAPLVSDIIAGLFLGSDREFQPGARVRAGDKGAEGEIVSMDIRKTYIRDEKGCIHVVPNSVIEKNEWVILHSVNEWPKKKRARSTGRRK